MDRNSAIGLSLILAIFVGFSLFNQPSDEEIAAAKRQNDSIAAAEQQLAIEAEKARKAVELSAAAADTLAPDSTLSDSALAVAQSQRYGAFAAAAAGIDGTIAIENDLIKVELSRKGGHPYRVTLKNYQRHDSTPLVLFEGDQNRFDLEFFLDNRVINTSDLYFNPSKDALTVTATDSGQVSMRLPAGEGRYLEYVYTLRGNSYLMGWEVNMVGLDGIIQKQATSLDLRWECHLPSQEKSLENQRMASTVMYRFSDDEVESLSEREPGKESISTDLQWVAFKQQFFSTVLMARGRIEAPAEVEAAWSETDSTTVKTMSARLLIPFGHKPSESVGFDLYLGPNHYETLSDMDRGLEKIVPLGWGIFGWVNEYAVIPVFNLLGGLNLNYGIVILLLTIILKLFLLPLTYGAYMSTAKMRVLKPEIDELNAKMGDKDPLAKQQATMDLYRKAGVNPMGGCLPMLLQMPILIALFNFFPASIELRQQAFLWADDLSTYDSVFNLPFVIPFYGSHVSLFTLLMTVSTILYTRMNASTMNMDNPQMKQMQWMMYLMPVIFLGVFNNYAAGLSYYYFLANMITFGQQYLFKAFVDEDKLHQKLQENKKKPMKKSNFQKKLEDMAKQRGLEQPKGKKK
jgi:YidC/Oxa1 family membrane protein insertase